MKVEIPCGQCIGCRLERSRQWAVRCVHEASCHDHNCFVTLTYNDDNYPLNGSLDLSHFQLFIKKLRKKYGSGIRYFHCGEYGDSYHRPHYHVCLFNFDFPDKKLYKVSGGNRLYTSDSCQSLWDDKGFCIVGSMTFQSAAYVARYVLKKTTGRLANNRYLVLLPQYYGTYEPYPLSCYVSLKPEYTSMSRRPGIGKAFFDKYNQEMYYDDMIIINGKKCRIPRYYDSQMEIVDPDRVLRTKISRQISAEKHESNNTYDRLRVREEVQRLRYKRLKRGFENDT